LIRLIYILLINKIRYISLIISSFGAVFICTVWLFHFTYADGRLVSSVLFPTHTACNTFLISLIFTGSFMSRKFQHNCIY
jgi:hypothetical protein